MVFRTHIILIALTLFAIGAFAFFWDQASEIEFVEEPKSTNHAISIVRATWGMNCHGLRMRSKVSKTLSGAQDNSRRRYDIKHNNVYEPVSSLCGGKPQCEIPIKEKTFGYDPAPRCRKVLEVEYRCFSYDQLRRERSDKRDSIYIDCAL